jgi:hypothetical protein
MNTTARRTVTTLAGVALAASAFAATGPSAVAAKAGTVKPPVAVAVTATVHDADVTFSYTISTKKYAGIAMECAVDAVPVDCWQSAVEGKASQWTYSKDVALSEYSQAEHVFTVTATSGTTSYAGSATFAGTGA